MNAMMTKSVLAAVVMFGTVLTLSASAGQVVLSKEQSAAVLETIKQQGGARLIVSQVVNPTTQQVEQVSYKDILSVDGTAKDNNGNVVAVVTLSEDKNPTYVPVYAYPVYYFNPSTGQWVLYHTFKDATEATGYINWIRNTFGLKTSCTATHTGWRMQVPAVVKPTVKTSQAPTSGGDAGDAGGPGLLGVQMDGAGTPRN